MADTRTPAQRRSIMQAVRSKNTGPELQVRKLIHNLGFRFSLHRRDLPGSPDIVLSSLRTAVFVHGCYWHGHQCAKGKLPKSNVSYWSAKIVANRLRDEANRKALRAMDWHAVTVWQCELKAEGKLRVRLRKALSERRKIRSTFSSKASKMKQSRKHTPRGF